MISTIKREQQRRELHGEQGFTLIELLIVIIVLGILAAIVVFALGSVTSQSAVAACNADAKTVSVAVSAYEAQHNGSIPVLANLVTDGDLKSTPSSTYYTVALDGTGLVTIALLTTAPGEAWTVGTGAAAGAAAQAYEGATPFVWGTTGGATSLPASAVGQNICAGA